MEMPNSDTITDAKKCLLTGAWYSCLLRGSARTWQIQMQMLTANHWTGHRDPNRGVRERTEGAEGFCNPIGRTTSNNQRSQDLNHQPRSTHGGTHGSSHICSRGCPCWTSMDEEAPGPVEAWCPSVGEGQWGCSGWVGGWEDTFIDAEGGGLV